MTEAQLRFLPEVGVQASASKYNAIYPFALPETYHNILLFPTAQDNIYSTRGYFNLPLYEGGRTLNTYRQAMAAQKQAIAQRDSVKMDVNLQVKEAYYRLLLAQERAAAVDKHLATIERFAADGGLSAWDAVEAEGALAAARASASETAHELESSRLAFRKAVSLELDTPFHVTGALSTSAQSIEVEREVLRAMELRPDLQSQTYKAQIDAIGVSLANGRRYPTVSIGGDYAQTAQDFPLI